MINLQKMLSEHNDAIQQKELIDNQIINLENRGILNFDLLPFEVSREMRKKTLKGLNEFSKDLDRQVCELSVWIDTAVDREREMEKQIEHGNA